MAYKHRYGKDGYFGLGGDPKPKKSTPAIRPLKARYATPPPRSDLVWLETEHFLAEAGETVLLAWPRTEGFTFRTGKHNGNVYVLSDDTQPREKPTFFASLKS